MTETPQSETKVAASLSLDGRGVPSNSLSLDGRGVGEGDSAPPPAVPPAVGGEAVGEIEVLKGQIKSLEAGLASAQTEGRAAVAAFRALTVAANPDVPADLVTGATVAEVTASLGKARELVAKVKASLDAAAHHGRVPPGAPGRTGPDLDGLSANEKIRLGIRK